MLRTAWDSEDKELESQIYLFLCIDKCIMWLDFLDLVFTDTSGVCWSENNLRTKFATLLSPNFLCYQRRGSRKYFWWNSRWHDVPTCEHKNDCENKLGHSFLGLESLPVDVDVRKLAIWRRYVWNKMGSTIKLVTMLYLRSHKAWGYTFYR